MDRTEECMELMARIDKLEEDLMTSKRFNGTSRFWDFIIKLTVPIVLALGTALVVHEVRISKVEVAVNGNKENIIGRAPVTVQEDIAEIKESIRNIDGRLYGVQDRLARIETKLESHVLEPKR